MGLEEAKFNGEESMSASQLGSVLMISAGFHGEIPDLAQADLTL